MISGIQSIDKNENIVGTVIVTISSFKDGNAMELNNSRILFGGKLFNMALISSVEDAFIPKEVKISFISITNG